MNKNYFYTPTKFLLDGGAMFGIIPKPLWNKRIDSDERNRITMTARIWVIRSKSKVVVVDSGLGNYHDQVFQDRFGMHYQETTEVTFQREMGISTNEVTDVVMTHLHFDHAGGLLTQGDSSLTLTFPNAKLHLASGHLDYSKKATVRDSGSFHSKHIEQVINHYRFKNLLQLYQSQEGYLKIDEVNLNFIMVHGHTPWQMLPYDKNFFFLGDTVPTTAHVDLPWVMGYDMAPGVSADERSKIYKMIMEKNLKVIFNHDIKHGAGKLIKNETGAFGWSELRAVKSEDAVWEEVE
jgi:glyoxylase-like metal-dependent hydrolase (beta-lactamase superfamily II)